MVPVSTLTLESPAAADRSYPAPKPGGSLAERFPEIAAEWDAEANAPLLASDVSFGTTRVASWQCPVGHGAYARRVVERTSGGHGCKECGRLRIVAASSAPRHGQTLAAAFPEIAATWDYEANHPLTPSDVAAHSNKKAFFTCLDCQKPHEVTISSRARTGAGTRCATVQKGAPKQGKSLADAFPEVAENWDYEANYPMTPSQVAPRSNKKAFFICPEGHGSHEGYISNRTAGNGCPECGLARRIASRRKDLLLTRNSVADTRPDLVAAWSARNSLRPDEVLPGSGHLIWWNCDAGHAPFAMPALRRTNGKGCPKCGNIKRNLAIAYTGPKPGESLAELRPDLVAEWDTAKNTVTPAEVGTKTDRVGFWVCSKAGRSYEQKIRSRCNAKECPCCRTERLAARKVSPKS
jgi:hypothetical protein